MCQCVRVCVCVKSQLPPWPLFPGRYPSSSDMVWAATSASPPRWFQRPSLRECLCVRASLYCEQRSQLLEVCSRLAVVERAAGVPREAGGGASCNDTATWMLVQDVVEKARRLVSVPRAVRVPALCPQSFPARLHAHGPLFYSMVLVVDG
jgi:hypothetical protein